MAEHVSFVRCHYILHDNRCRLGRMWLVRLGRTKWEVYLEWIQLGTLGPELFSWSAFQ